MIKEYLDKPPVSRIPDTCPTTGQFVVIWEYGNKVWSGTYRWGIQNKLYEYSKFNDNYNLIGEDAGLVWMDKNNLIAKFYIQSNN